MDSGLVVQENTLLKKIPLALFFVLATIASAQTAMIPTSGTRVLDNNGKPLAAGVISFTPTNAAGTPVAYTPFGGTLQAAGTSYTATVTNGQFSGLSIVNSAAASPSGLLFEIKVTGPSGSPVYLDLPKTGINLAGFSFDGYSVAPGLTVTGLGVPRVNCEPGGIYNQSDAASGSAPWVCSQLPTDGTVVWTQSPATAGACISGQALASPAYGPTYCIPAYEAWGLPGQGLVTPTNGTPGPLQMGASTGGTNGAQTPAGSGLLASAGTANSVRLATSQDVINTIGANVYDLYNSTIGATRISGQLTNAQLPTTLTASTTGNAATANGFLTAPGQCPQGQYLAGLTASVGLICGTPAGGSGSATLPTSTANNQFLFYPTAGSNTPTPTTITPATIGADPANAAANAQTAAQTYAAGLVAAGQTIAANTSGNAATANTAGALTNTPTLCPAGQVPTGILSNGNATGCAAAGSSLPAATAVNQIPLYQTAGSAVVTPTALTPALVQLPNFSDNNTVATIADAGGLQVAGPITSGTYNGTGSIAVNYAAGANGTTAMELVQFDASNLPNTSTGGYSGVAQQTSTSGQPVAITVAGVAQVLFDGPTVIKDIAIPSTTSPGLLHDSGVTSSLDPSLCGKSIVGVIGSTVSAANSPGYVRLHGAGSFGTGCTAAASQYFMTMYSATGSATQQGPSQISTDASGDISIPGTANVGGSGSQPSQVVFKPSPSACSVVTGDIADCAPTTITTAYADVKAAAPPSGTTPMMMTATNNGSNVVQRGYTAIPTFTQVYPGAGVPVSTGTAWGTSFTTLPATYFPAISGDGTITAGTLSLTVTALNSYNLLTHTGFLYDSAGTMSVVSKGGSGSVVPTAAGTFASNDCVTWNGSGGQQQDLGALYCSITTSGLKAVHLGAIYTTAPTFAAGTAAGTSPSVSLGGYSTDLSGVINVTAGPSPAASAAVVTVTFNTPYVTSAPKCWAIPNNAATQALVGAAQAQIFSANTTTTSFQLTQGATALTASTAYSWTYHCEQ